MLLATLDRSFAPVPPRLVSTRPPGGHAGNLANWPENLHSTARSPASGTISPTTLPSGSAGRNCHGLALKVSAPADIQGGDAVADERPSGVSDALSVRSTA